MKPQHGGNIWTLLERGSGTQAEVLDFSADLNPLGPPPGLELLLREAFREVAVYPEPTYRALREALAQMEGVEPDQILPGNGTAELIHLITRWRRSPRALVVVPTFTEYERAVLADGGEAVPLHLREEEEFDPEPLAQRPLPAGVQLCFLCNPNNPTGRVWLAGRLRQWLTACDRAGIDVVLDEAYMDFVVAGASGSATTRRGSVAGASGSATTRRGSVAGASGSATTRPGSWPAGRSSVAWIREFPRLMVLRSLTKSFGVPGLRIGYLVAGADRVRALQQIQPPWAVNGLAALAGRWLAGQGAYLEICRRQISLFQEAMGQELRALRGVRVFPSDCNFFLCGLSSSGRKLSSSGLTGGSSPSASLARLLAEKGILIRVCDDFTGLAPGGFFRVAVRTPQENARLIGSLREAL